MLKKGIAFLISMLLLCTEFIFSVVAQNSENLILNSDFESGTIDSWAYDGGKISISDDSHSGNYSIYNTAGEITQIVDVEPGEIYIYSAWVKAENNPMIFGVNIWDDKKWNENNSNYGNWALDNILLNIQPGNWTYAEKIFKTGEDSNEVKVYIAGYNTSWNPIESYNVDDLYLSKLSFKSQISGPDSIACDTESKSFPYSVSVTNQFGGRTGVGVADNVWSLKEDINGISIDSATGVVTVSPEADAENITICCSSTVMVDGYSESLTSYCEKTVSISEYDPLYNMILNPGFETGDLSQWTYETAFATISDEEKYSGDYSVKLATSAVEQTVAVEPDTYYLYSVNINATKEMKLCAGVWDGIIVGGDGRSWILNYFRDYDGGNWYNITKVLKTNSDSDKVIARISGYTTGWQSDGTQFYADDMYLGKFGLKIDISGKDKIMKPSDESLTVGYTANIANNIGTQEFLSDIQSPVWSLDSEYAGVSINEQTGELTVTKEAQIGKIKIICETSAQGIGEIPYGDDGNQSFSIPLTGKKIKTVEITPVAPVVENLEIDVLNNEGNAILKPFYKYLHQENIPESNTAFSWKASDTQDGEYVEFSTSNEITLSSGQYNYIKLEITPMDADGRTGDTVCTNAVEVSKLFAQAPQISSAKINLPDKASVGKKAEIIYETTDENALIKVIWERAKTNSGYVEISTEKDYVFTKDDVDSKLRAKVIPYYKSDDFNILGNEIVTPEITSVTIPSVSGVTIKSISGSLNNYYVDYVYTNGNGVSDNSKITWTLNGGVISTTSSCELSPSSYGTLTVEVIPVSDDGVEGVPQTAVLEVSYVTAGEGSVTSSGGSSIRGSSSTPIAVKPSEDSEKEENKDDDNNTTKAFSDIKGHWAEETINKLYENGIIKGDSNNKFNPDSNITRAEAVTLVMRCIVDYTDTYLYGTFNDVKFEDWYAGNLMTAYNAGIFNGDSTGKANPDSTITRQELASIIVRAIEFYTQDSLDMESELEFTDTASISSWAITNMKKAVSAGMLSGNPDGTVAPLNFATRAECAVIIERLLGIID